MLTKAKIREVATKIAEHKGWAPKALNDEAFMALVDETVVMTVRALEMVGLRVVENEGTQ